MPSNYPPGTAAPIGPAGGDLGGTYPDPDVVALQGNPVGATAPSNGDVLTWNGTTWAPAAGGGGGFTEPVTFTQPFAILNDGDDKQVLTDVTPGTTNVVALPTTPLKLVEVPADYTPLFLDETTPFTPGTLDGQTFWLLNAPDSEGEFRIFSGGNVIAEFVEGALAFPPGTIAQFTWADAPQFWIQIGKAFTISV